MSTVEVAPVHTACVCTRAHPRGFLHRTLSDGCIPRANSTFAPTRLACSDSVGRRRVGSGPTHPTPHAHTTGGVYGTIPFSRNAPFESYRRPVVFESNLKSQDGGGVVPVEKLVLPSPSGDYQPPVFNCLTEGRFVLHRTGKKRGISA